MSREPDAPTRSWRVITCDASPAVSGEIVTGPARHPRRRGLRTRIGGTDDVREVWRRATESVADLVASEPAKIRDGRRAGVSDVRLRWSRHVAVWLTREITGASYPTIGRVIDRDHTTVLHDCREVEAELAGGPSPVRLLIVATIDRMARIGRAR